MLLQCAAAEQFRGQPPGPGDELTRRSRTSPATSGASRPPGLSRSGCGLCHVVRARTRPSPQRIADDMRRLPAQFVEADVRRGRQGHSCRETRSDSGAAVVTRHGRRSPLESFGGRQLRRETMPGRTTSGTGAATGPVRRPEVDQFVGIPFLDQRRDSVPRKIGFTGDRDHHQRQRYARAAVRSVPGEPWTAHWLSTTPTDVVVYRRPAPTTLTSPTRWAALTDSIGTWLARPVAQKTRSGVAILSRSPFSSVRNRSGGNREFES